MACGDVKKIKRWAFFGFSLWALLAFVAWHRVENCSSMFSEYCLGVYGSGVLKFLSLSWVWDYQTLIAGVGAFVGARLVLSAAQVTADNNFALQKSQQLEAQRKENARRKELALEACTLVRSDFREAIKQLTRRANEEKSAEKPPVLFSRTSAHMGALVAICPQLALIVAARISEVQFALTSTSTSEITEELAHCEVIFAILEGISDHLSEEGTYDLDRERKLSAQNVRGCLKRLGYRLEDISGLRYYFNPET